MYIVLNREEPLGGYTLWFYLVREGSQGFGVHVVVGFLQVTFGKVIDE